MKVLKFNLSGSTAFFKNPQVKMKIRSTYGQIHKVAILGILGACMGLRGYCEQDELEEYPEFYNKLKDLQIAIVPKCKNGVFRRTIQTFANTTGFANTDSDGCGVRLVVREQWLEDPNWDIYILLNNDDLSKELEDRFTKMSFEYLPYLGRNEHFANISDVEILSDVSKVDNFNKISSLFDEKYFKFSKDYSLEEGENLFISREELPEGLKPRTNKCRINKYRLNTYTYTNVFVSKSEETDVYKVKDLNLCFI